MARVSGVPDPVVSDLVPGGVLRAAINLGNPVLAQGTPAAPAGVTVDIARELARRLGVPVELTGVSAARDSFAAMQQGHADICFLAIEPPGPPRSPSPRRIWSSRASSSFPRAHRWPPRPTLTPRGCGSA